VAPPWDESTRPSAGSTADDGTATPRGAAAGQHLVEVHDHYRAELTQLRDVLEQVRAGNRGAGSARSALNEMAVRANTWVLGSVCQTYCLALTQHHSMEDAAVFPHLASQGDGLAAVITRLGDEHVAIHELLKGVDRSLVDLVREPGDLTAVDAAVDALTAALLSHFTYEERELVGPLSKHGFYPGQV
jgi:iron-sulfur cluster repair protein YtfE (RIC family)